MLKSAQIRTVKTASLMKSNCWPGCRSVAARLATGKQKGCYPSSRLADDACMTGPACKPRSCAASKAGHGEHFAIADRCPLGMVRPGPQTARGWLLTDRARLCRCLYSEHATAKVCTIVHRVRGEFRFAQFLHTAKSCTEFAQGILPEVAQRSHRSIDIIGFCLLFYGHEHNTSGNLGHQ